ncbi:hypothetical protein GOODEAATRI_010460 [Goodea atripinnis]|uniref:Uncharacterized protein n=1 Tax=Goodea atripinnis TaxID=208336 RepID=A0ABV0NK31_9TELE
MADLQDKPAIAPTKYGNLSMCCTNRNVWRFFSLSETITAGDGVKPTEERARLSPLPPRSKKGGAQPLWHRALSERPGAQRCATAGDRRAQQSLPTEDRSTAQWSVRGPHLWPVRSGQLGVTSEFWGQFGRVQERQPREKKEEEEEESRPFLSSSPGDASVNARAMSRRKQGNPQHLSQREITRKLPCVTFHRLTLRCFPFSFLGA